MPIQFKVHWRSHGDDQTVSLNATAKDVERRTRMEIWIAPDGRYNGLPQKLRILVPFRKVPPPPHPPEGYHGEKDTAPDAEEYRSKRDRQRKAYEDSRAGAMLLANALADYLGHVVDGQATPPDPILQAYLKGLLE